MAVNLSCFAGAGAQFFDNNGTPLSGGLLYTYAAGTTTPLETYTTLAGVTANSNPIVLNSAGRVANEIWLNAGSTYKFLLQTSVAVQIGVWDNIPGSNDLSALSLPTGSASVGFIQSGTGAVATTVQAKLREYVSVTDFGAVGDGVTPDDAAFAAWTTEIATTKKIGYIPPTTAFYKLTKPWDCTSAKGTSSGLTIVGAGLNSSVIKFICSGADINTMVGWDLTGCAYGSFKDFSVWGGTLQADNATPNTNYPYVTMLYGGATSGGSGFGGLSTFERVLFLNGGDYTIVNQGAEQLDYIDCEAYGFRLNGLQVTFYYVASSSNVVIQSPFVGTCSGTVSSMTQVNWHGARAVMQGTYRIVLFHMTAAGGVLSIYHDGYTVVGSSAAAGGAANPFIIMGDDASGLAGTSVQHCGMRDCIVEAKATTGHVVNLVCTVPTNRDWHFRGRNSIGVPLLDVLFQFTSDPSSGTIEWVPNDTGAWSGSAIVSAPSGGNLSIATPYVANSNDVGGIITLSGTNSAISGYQTFNYTVGGQDFQEIGGLRKRGPAGNGVFSVLEVERSANRISASSDSYSGEITTANVTGAGATAIYTLSNQAQLCVVTGVNSATGDIFADLLLVTTANANVIQSSTVQNSPAARTYSIATTKLALIMATGTYQIRTKVMGCGVQA